VRAYATNSVNTSYGAEVDFTTAAKTATITVDPGMTEENLNSKTITVTLAGDTYAASLDKEKFTLNNAPSGTTISSVTRTDDTHAAIVLAYDGTDFDANITTFNITIAADQLAGAVDLTSGNLTITATIEVAPTVTTTDPVSAIASTTATAGGNVSADGGETVTAKGIVYSTTTAPTIADTKVVDGSGIGDITASLTGLAPSTTYHVRAYATNSVNTSYGAEVDFTTAPTYTITAIADQTLTAVTAGYGAGTQETKTLSITRTGTGDLTSLATDLSGAGAGNFTITQPLVTTLNDGTSSTTFTVKANNGLAAGTYTATVTVSAINMTNVTFTVTQVVNAASGGGDSGGGSTPPPAPPILTNIKTQDERGLEGSLQQTGEAKIELASTATGQATITGNVLGQLSQLDKPLTIAGQGVSLQFAPNSLQLPQGTGQDNNDTVQIGAAAVTPQEQQAILAATPLGGSTGIFQVGGQVFNLTAQVNTTSGGATNTENVSTFSQPVAVTIDLSGLNLTDEQISGLSGARLEIDADGNVVPVFLGGRYDPVTQTITFYTDHFSLYTVLQKNGIVILNLTIGNTITKLNGEVKTIDVPPSLINNRTFVPLRFIGEALGASFDWDDKTKTVTFQSGAKKLALTVGQTIPGMDTPPTIVSGRTMVPLRYISETFGAHVMWFPASQSVSVVK